MNQESSVSVRKEGDLGEPTEYEAECCHDANGQAKYEHEYGGAEWWSRLFEQLGHDCLHPEIDQQAEKRKHGADEMNDGNIWDLYEEERQL